MLHAIIQIKSLTVIGTTLRPDGTQQKMSIYLSETNYHTDNRWCCPKRTTSDIWTKKQSNQETVAREAAMACSEKQIHEYYWPAQADTFIVAVR